MSFQPRHAGLIVCVTLLSVKENCQDAARIAATINKNFPRFHETGMMGANGATEQSKHRSDQIMTATRMKKQLQGITKADVEGVWQWLNAEIPAWVDFVRRHVAKSEAGSVMDSLLSQGLLESCELPGNRIDRKGLQNTMENLLRLARQYDCHYESRRERAYTRTLKGEEDGYESDGQYPSWDHPGNLGF